MFTRVIKYSNRYFSLFKNIENITDLRQKPQISASDISASILSLLFSNLGSLNKFNAARIVSSISNITGRIPSSSTVDRSADSLDLDVLRQILKSI